MKLPLNVHPTLGPLFRAEAGDFAAWWRNERSQTDAAARLASARGRSWWWRRYASDHLDDVVATGAPFVSRQLLKRYPGAFVGDLAAVRLGYLGRTSGSTGEPLDVLMGAWAVAYYYLYLEWALALAGVRSDWVRLAYLSRNTGAESYREPFATGGGELFRVDLPEGESALGVVERLGANVVTTTPSLLASVCDEPAASAALEVVLVTAEHLCQTLSDRAAERLGVRVLDSYGVAEVGPVALACPARSDQGPERRYHVEPCGTYIELLGGEIALTTLRNRALPISRYLTGDHARSLEEGVCLACGFDGQSIVGLDGRSRALLPLADGSDVSPLPWIRVLTDPRWTLERFQIVSVGPGSLEVRAVGLAGAARADLLRALQDASETMDVALSEASPIRLASGKIPSVI